MITQNEIKTIQSLHLKKFRQKYNLFVAEGKKLTQEFVKSSFEIRKIYTLQVYDFLQDINPNIIELIEEKQLKKITFLTNHQEIFCLVKIPNEIFFQLNINTLVLENIQDPGNLGTIIRLADWFGISQIICSNNTVDAYNPKVVQATMGSIARVAIVYTEIFEFLSNYKGVVLGTDMQGNSVYEQTIKEPFALIMANEGNGITDAILKLCNEKISIPKVGNSTIESLNVAMSTGIVLSEIIGAKLRK